MEGLISLTKKTTPSNYHYICEKNGGSLSDKVKYPYHDLAGRLLKLISHSQKFWQVLFAANTDGWTCLLCSWYAGIRSLWLWSGKIWANYESWKRGKHPRQSSFDIEVFKSLHFTLRSNMLFCLLIELLFFSPFHSCHSLLGPAIISTKPLPWSCLARTIFPMLDR